MLRGAMGEIKHGVRELFLDEDVKVASQTLLTSILQDEKIHKSLIKGAWANMKLF
jgi:hypothetical protein